MIARCAAYPQLFVNDLKIRFSDGAARVTVSQALALQKMQHFSFELTNEEETEMLKFEEISTKRVLFPMDKNTEALYLSKPGEYKLLGPYKKSVPTPEEKPAAKPKKKKPGSGGEIEEPANDAGN